MVTIIPFIYFGCSRAIMNKKQLKPDLKLADKFLDLKTLDTNIILNHLDGQIKVREMPIEKRLKRDMLK